ncbi:MAG: GTPase HflX [Desulfobacterales bacterium]|nr:GTPase HflX [Desulfobacterales bacterium]
MKKLQGNLAGLKSNHKKRLDKLYKRRIPVESIITKEVADELANLSQETGRQIGLLINRSGKIIYVIVGDQQQIYIPETPDYISSHGRMKGLRCIHTHLKNEELTQDDFTDLSLLKLDIIAAITIKNSKADLIHSAVINPLSEAPYRKLDSVPAYKIPDDCNFLIEETEADLSKAESLHISEKGKERAYLVKVYTGSKNDAQDSMLELVELTKSSGLSVIDTTLQKRKKIDPNFVVGKGKLFDIAINAMQKGATIIIFDRELSPSQIRSITNHLEMKIIDRNQLILDIFAQRAKSKEGKLQVELAQMKYMLPRLIEMNTAMSRLTGGIGGRGPGETKLEVNRRTVRDKINKLEKSVKKVRGQRKQQKAQRVKKNIPVVSIVGYTNAGKSTLINSLTNSKIYAKDQLFATLDPSSRRLRFPKDIEVIITDTVGFIRRLPKELVESFKATLEELESAIILLHVIDISNPSYEDHIRSVEKILTDLNLHKIKTIYVLNKIDQCESDIIEAAINKTSGYAISAMDRSTLSPLLDEIENLLTIGNL